MHPCLCAHCLAAGQAAKLPQSLPGSASVLGFANPPHARRCIWPYRVHHFLNYGLVVRFRLPSTPSLDDAVAFSYGQPVLCPTGTLTRCWCALSGARRDGLRATIDTNLAFLPGFF